MVIVKLAIFIICLLASVIYFFRIAFKGKLLSKEFTQKIEYSFGILGISFTPIYLANIKLLDHSNPNYEVLLLLTSAGFVTLLIVILLLINMANKGR